MGLEFTMQQLILHLLDKLIIYTERIWVFTFTEA